MLENRWVVVTSVAAVMGLGLLSLAWTPRTAATPVASDAEKAAFRGKVLLVRSSFGIESYVVEQARVRQLGTQTFLVGKAVESNGGHTDVKGKTVWLNLASITAIVECEDADAAKKMLRAVPQGLPAIGS